MATRQDQAFFFVALAALWILCLSYFGLDPNTRPLVARFCSMGGISVLLCYVGAVVGGVVHLPTYHTHTGIPPLPPPLAHAPPISSGVGLDQLAATLSQAINASRPHDPGRFSLPGIRKVLRDNAITGVILDEAAIRNFVNIPDVKAVINHVHSLFVNNSDDPLLDEIQLNNRELMKLVVPSDALAIPYATLFNVSTQELMSDFVEWCSGVKLCFLTDVRLEIVALLKDLAATHAADAAAPRSPYDLAKACVSPLSSFYMILENHPAYVNSDHVKQLLAVLPTSMRSVMSTLPSAVDNGTRGEVTLHNVPTVLGELLSTLHRTIQSTENNMKAPSSPSSPGLPVVAALAPRRPRGPSAERRPFRANLPCPRDPECHLNLVTAVNAPAEATAPVCKGTHEGWTSSSDEHKLKVAKDAFTHFNSDNARRRYGAFRPTPELLRLMTVLGLVAAARGLCSPPVTPAAPSESFGTLYYVTASPANVSDPTHAVAAITSSSIPVPLHHPIWSSDAITPDLLPSSDPGIRHNKTHSL